MIAILDPPPRSYRTDAESRLYAKLRRVELLDGGWCINGQGHGKATHGVRCKRCHDVHKGGEPPPRIVKTHCKRGHAFTASNTTCKSGGRRSCKTCHRVLAWCRFRVLDQDEIERVFASLPNQPNER